MRSKLIAISSIKKITFSADRQFLSFWWEDFRHWPVTVGVSIWIHAESRCYETRKTSVYQGIPPRWDTNCRHMETESLENHGLRGFSSQGKPIFAI